MDIAKIVIRCYLTFIKEEWANIGKHYEVQTN